MIVSQSVALCVPGFIEVPGHFLGICQCYCIAAGKGVVKSEVTVGTDESFFRTGKGGSVDQIQHFLKGSSRHLAAEEHGFMKSR